MDQLMNTEPVRVAQIIGKLSAGGVESVVYNYYRHMDHSKFQFDFIYDADSTCQPRQDLIDMGARYFKIPPYQKLPQYILALTRLFWKNQYQIVHAHMNTLSVFSLFAAWAAGVPVRICHNHSTAGRGETAKNIMKYVLRPFSRLFATNYCACSRYAGEWLFGKRVVAQGKVTIFNNAIETERFRFNPKVREAVRRELNVDGKFVIGHVGRFCFQKNHEFLIDIFAEVSRQRENAVLLLIGEGNLFEHAKEKVHSLGLDDAVIFAGQCYDMGRIYQAIDVFVLPSRYEGLPVVGVEAQAAGLPCIVSDCITKEMWLTDHIVFLSLSVGAQGWAKEISHCGTGRRENTAQAIQACGFDIGVECMKLQAFYSKI